MGDRHKARELALQLLYQIDISQTSSDEALPVFWAREKTEEDVREFVADLVKGVSDHREEIDQKIEKQSKNWKIYRMACIDRNILRMAIYEIFYRTDIPRNVTLDEAIELAKTFGTEDSGSFVNGVLDAIPIEEEDGSKK
jgi:N utilization substance protein B